jgi:hypothetical protein
MPTPGLKEPGKRSRSNRDSETWPKGREHLRLSTLYAEVREARTPITVGPKLLSLSPAPAKMVQIYDWLSVECPIGAEIFEPVGYSTGNQS